jgi:hypothetical protein
MNDDFCSIFLNFTYIIWKTKNTPVWTIPSILIFIYYICYICYRDASCVIVNVEYRLAPEYKFPCNHDDALCAVQWVKNHRKDLGKYSIVFYNNTTAN